MAITNEPNGTRRPQLRRVARKGSPSYVAAMVFYLVATAALFGELGQGGLALAHGDPWRAGGGVIVGFAAWWLGAGCAIRLGVRPRDFFGSLAGLLER